MTQWILVRFFAQLREAYGDASLELHHNTPAGMMWRRCALILRNAIADDRQGTEMTQLSCTTNPCRHDVAALRTHIAQCHRGTAGRGAGMTQ